MSRRKPIKALADKAARYAPDDERHAKRFQRQIEIAQEVGARICDGDFDPDTAAGHVKNLTGLSTELSRQYVMVGWETRLLREGMI